MKIHLTDPKFSIQMVLLWVKNKSSQPPFFWLASLMIGFLSQTMQGGNYVPSLVLVKLVLSLNIKIRERLTLCRTFPSSCLEKDGSLTIFFLALFSFSVSTMDFAPLMDWAIFYFFEIC